MRVSFEKNRERISVGKPSEEICDPFFDDDMFYQLDNGIFYRGEVFKGTKVPHGLGVLLNVSKLSKATIRLQWFSEGLMRGDYSMVD